jgi:hypothetical protein
MFYVKAVSGDGAEFAIFEAVSVRVEESKINGANGPGQPPFVAPDYDVYLYGEDERHPATRILRVGRGDGHHHVVFVMNERGKTIDKVDSRERPDMVVRAQRAA